MDCFVSYRAVSEVGEGLLVLFWTVRVYIIEVWFDQRIDGMENWGGGLLYCTVYT